MLRKFSSSLLGTAFQKLFESPRMTTKKIKQTLKHSTPIIKKASTIATIHSCSPLKYKIKQNSTTKLKERPTTKADLAKEISKPPPG